MTVFFENLVRLDTYNSSMQFKTIWPKVGQNILLGSYYTYWSYYNILVYVLF